MQTRPDFVPNVGGRDRALRLVAGVVFVALAFALDMASGWRLAAYLIGAAALLTALALLPHQCGARRQHASPQAKESLMSLTAWMITGILVGLLTPFIALASLARAAWTALRERVGAHA